MPVSYAKDIRQLFRTKDINAMLNFGGFDLSNYQDVVEHAEGILKRLRDGDMPCDGAWPQTNIDLFSQWIDDGKLA